MLNIEIEDNLAALDTFRRAAESKVTHPNTALANMQRRDALTQTALPNWRRRIWERLSASLPLDLTEQNIRSVNRFYAGLDELAELQGLARGDTRQRDPFTQKLDAILQQGNPLSS